jgi:hypothetical protein
MLNAIFFSVCKKRNQDIVELPSNAIGKAVFAIFARFQISCAWK